MQTEVVVNFRIVSVKQIETRRIDIVSLMSPVMDMPFASEPVISTLEADIIFSIASCLPPQETAAIIVITAIEIFKTLFFICFNFIYLYSLVDTNDFFHQRK